MENITNKNSKTKNVLFKKEQQEVANKLHIILGITDTNNSFILDDLKSNEEQQKQIIELEGDVKKYFKYASWPYFKKTVDNRYLSLMRSIYKNTGYNITYKITSRNKKYIYIYYINKN
jgi:hypothetical protein